MRWLAAAALLFLLAPSSTRAASGRGGTTVADGGPRWAADLCAVPGVACDGVTNDRVLAAAAVAGGGEWVVPAGKHLLLGAPGNGNAGLTLTSNGALRCEPGSKVSVATKVCSTGRYAGAPCAGDGDCNYCGAGCTGSTCAGTPFVGTSETSAVIRSTASNPSVIGCKIDVAQVANFNVCSNPPSGTNNGKPCREVCTTTSGSGIGLANGTTMIPCSYDPTTGLERNNTDADAFCATLIGSGSLCFRDDCFDVGGTCVGGASPSGPGTINPIDFSSASDAVVRDVWIDNARVGDYSVNAGAGAYVAGVRNARHTRPAFFPDLPLPTPAITAGILCSSCSIERSPKVYGTSYAVRVTGGSGSMVTANATASYLGDAPNTGISINEDSGIAIGNRVPNATTVALELTANRAQGIGNLLRPDNGGTAARLVTNYLGLTGCHLEPSGTGDQARAIYIDCSLVCQNRVEDNTIVGFGLASTQARLSFNVSVVGNRFTGSQGEGAWRAFGAGFVFNDNYVNVPTSRKTCGTTCSDRGETCTVDGDCSSCGNSSYQCVLEPTLWLGTNDPIAKPVAHPQVQNNIFSGNVGQSAIRVAHIGKRCTVNGTGGPGLDAPCTVNGDCGTGGTCGGESQMANGLVTGNQCFGSGACLDMGEINSSGTMVDEWGIAGNVGNASYIRFPALQSQARRLKVKGNSIEGGDSSGEVYPNWDHRMGQFQLNAPLGVTEDNPEDVQYLVNKTGSTGRQFDVVQLSTSDANSFVLATANSRAAVGCLLDEPANNAVGRVAFGGVVPCNTTDVSVGIGTRLRVSGTAGVFEPVGSAAEASPAVTREVATDLSGFRTVRVQLNSYSGPVIPDCDNATSGKLLFDQSTNGFTCGADQTGGLGTVVRKPSDESVTSSTTLQNDDHLTVSLATNTNYYVRGVATFFSTVGSGDAKMGFTIPASTTMGIGVQCAVPLTLPVWFTTTAGSTGQINFGASEEAPCFFSGTVQTGGTSGNLTVQWAQNSSQGTATIMRAGSFIIVTAY